MQLTKILETALYVNNLAEAEHFYCEILGLEKVSSTPDRDLFLRCGNSMLILFNAEQTQLDGGVVPTHGSSGRGHIAFGVPKVDLPEWIKILEDKGVAIEKKVTWDKRDESVYFRDPNGNSIEIASETLYNPE